MILFPHKRQFVRELDAALKRHAFLDETHDANPHTTNHELEQLLRTAKILRTHAAQTPKAPVALTERILLTLPHTRMLAPSSSSFQQWIRSFTAPQLTLATSVPLLLLLAAVTLFQFSNDAPYAYAESKFENAEYRVLVAEESREKAYQDIAFAELLTSIERNTRTVDATGTSQFPISADHRPEIDDNLDDIDAIDIDTLDNILSPI